MKTIAILQSGGEWRIRPFSKQNWLHLFCMCSNKTSQAKTKS